MNVFFWYFMIVVKVLRKWKEGQKEGIVELVGKWSKIGM